MAVEWVGLGVAVAKVLLRATDQGPVADWVGDGSDLVLRLRGLRRHSGDVGREIARTLQQELTPDLSGEDEREIKAAALEVTALLKHLAESDEALLHAATRPDTFLAYAKDHAGDRARRRVGLRAEPAFDRILQAACKQLAALAPWSPGFNRTAVVELVDQLAHLSGLVQQSVDNSRESADNSRLVLEHLQRNTGPDVVEASLTANRHDVRFGGPVRDWAASDLRVHDTIRVEDATGLTPYILRQHDFQLRQVMTDLTRPKMVTVVGTSCTGKTRTCVEAVRAILPDWTLVNPVDVEQLSSILRAGVPAQTVVWLDELQNFLTVIGGVEAVRAIRRLLSDRRTPPLLFLGTIWPDNLITLETRPTADQAAVTGLSDISTLLIETKADRIQVPPAFTLEELQAADGDPRVRVAIRHAVEGQVTQVLAGGTQLVDRVYGTEGFPGAYSAVARAVILATADLRRVGYPDPVPAWAIAGAAHGYLGQDEKRYLTSTSWAEHALGQLEQEARAHHEGQRDLHQSGVPALRPAREVGYFELHDYLLQHHVAVRRYHPTTAELWRTLTDRANSGQLDPRIAAALGGNARLRGLKQEALELLRGVADTGDWSAQAAAARLLVERGDEEAVAELRARANAPDDRRAQGKLADLLVERGDEEAVAELRARADAGDRSARGRLVTLLVERGDEEAVAELRARANTPDDQRAQGKLADLLVERGDAEAVAELRARADAGDRSAQTRLITLLMKRRGDEEAVAELRARADAGDESAQASFADLLVERGDEEALAELRARADAGDESAKASFADLLVERGDEEAVAELRARADAGDRSAQSRLITLLVERGDEEAVAELRARADAGDRLAQARLVSLLVERRGDEEAAAELRARADAGDRSAQSRLITLLVERGDEEAVAELRARADAGDRLAQARLVTLLLERGDEEAIAEWEVRSNIDFAQDGPTDLQLKQGDEEAIVKLRAQANAGNRIAQSWFVEREAEAEELKRLVHAAYSGAARALLHHYRRHSRVDCALQLDFNGDPKQWTFLPD